MATPNNSNQDEDWYMFAIVKMAHQKFAEVDTKFVEHYRGQLQEFWKVKKTDTDFHKLKFNNDYENPLILIQGWNKFKEWNDLSDNVQVQLIYRGNNEFDIDGIYELTSDQHIPAFHSRCLHPIDTTYFDLEVTPANIYAPKFRVDNEFAHSIVKNNFEYLVLCGENGEKFTINVLNSPHIHKIKLGRNWDDFCTWQKLKRGDVIRFKFTNGRPTASKRVHVYKLG